VRILGIDPSVRCTGYAILESVGKTPTAIFFGKIQNPPRLTQAECAFRIYQTIRGLILEYRPEEVAMEGVIYVQNTRTAVALGGARGAAMAAIGEGNLPFFEYPAKSVKKAVTGTGGAQKNQVGFMMRAILGLKETPGPDEADALAIAMAHAQARVIGRLKAE